ncbi:hypothetical protein SISSUDRAFT_1068416 [Sistotremastrum suecicum HHB10207 ss-3]|uniref:Exonuclease domain-containing protein n=1 Tax=Sistotremastrum suecicum HHB10207 ss-3 TaxID=1314776 RepID=A0A166JAV0_9AGAM|nr:hypothetical protein SISSUDRAFT_1068416 [Sistotremastrum suecicum HHB10207 ss-3]
MSPRPDQYISLSCLCVGIGPGGSTSMLAQVTILDVHGRTLLGTYVRPTNPVTDYRTSVTGIEAKHLEPGRKIHDVQRLASQIFQNKIIIGHTLWSEFSVLGIPHPAVDTRDLALYLPFRTHIKSNAPVIGLQTLVWNFLERKIQEGHQKTSENASACLELFKANAGTWENFIQEGKWPCSLPPDQYSRCYL